MEFIDTHCHLTFEALAGDVEAVLERSCAAGVTEWVTVGTDARHSRKAIELAERFDNMYATVGIHPHDAKDVTGDVLAELRELARHEKVVAIGETGLDFHYNFSPPEEQRRTFAAQLKIASELNLPVIVHSREAFDETVNILEHHGGDVRKVVFHCFPGPGEHARIVVGKGWHVSFTGVVTFKNAVNVREAAGVVPLDRMMLETDCPYMSPAPMRKQKVNEPALMIHTARFMADLKNMDFDEFAKAVTKTSREFFNLPGRV
jgi:TatD DNase family protein